jgi:uncharacterized repeat protein (TIGR03809 family)
MSARQCAHRFDELAQKWRILAERRCAHFLELYQSGRWEHYYRSEEQFVHCLYEAIRVTDRWAEIAPAPPAKTVAQEAPLGAHPPRRTAA